MVLEISDNADDTVFAYFHTASFIPAMSQYPLLMRVLHSSGSWAGQDEVVFLANGQGSESSLLPDDWLSSFSSLMVATRPTGEGSWPILVGQYSAQWMAISLLRTAVLDVCFWAEGLEHLNLVWEIASLTWGHLWVVSHKILSSQPKLVENHASLNHTWSDTLLFYMPFREILKKLSPN